MINSIVYFFKELTSEQIALVSVIVTILLYVLGKHNELRFKKHELKKEKYLQFVSLLRDTYIEGTKFVLDEQKKIKFFEFGSMLLIYGSKKMYKKYCFFREFSSEFVKKQTYYDEKINLYLIADMLNQMRKEIGMYDYERSLNYASIAFFTNDIYFNPIIDLEWWDNKIKVFLIKTELLLYKIESLVLLKIIIKILLVPFKILNLLKKYIILIPLGRFCVKFGIDKKLQLNENNPKIKK